VRDPGAFAALVEVSGRALDAVAGSAEPTSA